MPSDDPRRVEDDRDPRWSASGSSSATSDGPADSHRACLQTDVARGVVAGAGDLGRTSKRTGPGQPAAISSKSRSGPPKVWTGVAADRGTNE